MIRPLIILIRLAVTRGVIPVQPTNCPEALRLAVGPVVAVRTVDRFRQVPEQFQHVHSMNSWSLATCSSDSQRR
jgi:hypothetical protein